MTTQERTFGGPRPGAAVEASVRLAELAETNPDAAQLGLPSEHFAQGRFPALLTTGDLVVLGTILILYVTNISVVTFAGATALPYWVLGFLTFLLPSAVTTSKLARMFPGEGAFYVWVQKALGSFCASLLGFFCLWWPPVLLVLAAGAAVVGFLQSIGASVGQAWFAAPWQQGLVVLLVLCMAWVLARLPVESARRLLRGTCYLYLGLLLCMGVVAGGWLVFAHHASQTDFSQGTFDLNGSNITFYSTVILACLGIQLPLNMAGEVREPGAVSRYLPRTMLVVVCGYLVVWFAMAVILPQDPTNPLSAGNPGNIGQIFAVALGQSVPGQVISALASLILCAFYIVSSGAYGMVQSRLLVMASLDRRLPLALAQLDQQGVPRAAITWQFVIQALVALVIFLLAPALSAQGAAYETIVYNVLSASGVVLWAISALALFVIGAILVLRFPEQARASRGPSSALVVLCGVIGAAATLACIWLVFTGPWITQMAGGDWFFWVMFLVLASLAVGAVYSFLAPEPADIWALFARTQRPSPGR